jgi:glycosyltransferase involved in cell wall biosynthesis
MRILLINQSYPPMVSGVSIVVQKFAQGFARRGHEVQVVAASDQTRGYVTEEEGVIVIRLPSFRNPARKNQRAILGARRMLGRLIQRTRPDIIHVHDVLIAGPVLVSIPKARRSPILAMVHQLPNFLTAYLPRWRVVNQAIERQLWTYSRWLRNQMDDLVTPTGTTARVIREKGGYHVSVISNGVDLGQFNPKPADALERRMLCERYGIDPGRPILLHVGRLDIDKQVDKALEAAAGVLQHTSAQVLIVGDGTQRTRLERLVDEWGIAKRTIFTGNIASDGDLPGMYRLGDVFITASEIETQGLVLLEALATGLPVVCYRATCLPEIIFSGYNGYMVTPGDTAMMTRRIVELASDPQKRARFGIKGREVVQMHSLEASLDQYEGLYRELIQGRKKGRNPSAIKPDWDRWQGSSPTRGRPPLQT